MTTRAAPVPPVLKITSAGAMPIRLSFTGETNRNYHLQAATNLAAAIWADLLVTNAPAASFTDTQSVSLPRRCYRVQIGP